jgi:RNA polymerase sigma factor (sigma-70 family)
MPMDDAELLRSYLAERSEAAFRELVRRHGALVHGVARRQAGIDAHLADDVTQRVFLALARKADAVRDPAALVGWLYQAARFEAARTIRTEARRRQREEAAHAMNESPSPESAPELAWEKLQPVLDDAMAQLDEPERNAVLLRFFSQRSFAEVGRMFQISEDAARKRVERAVDKLRLTLARRGIASTSSALGVVLGAHAAPAVADEALAAIAHGAWQQSTVSAAVHAGVFMSTTKTTVIAGAALLLAGVWVARDFSALRRAEAGQAAAVAELAAQTQRHASARRDLVAAQRQAGDADTRWRAQLLSAPNAVRPHLQDPTYHELARRLSQARFHLEFQRLYRQLGLSPDQMARFEAIMVRQDQAALDGQIARDLGQDEQRIYRRSGPEWNSAMRELLGSEGMEQLQVYLRSTSIQRFIDGVAAKSYENGTPITLAQADQLIATALAHDPTYQSGKGTDPAKVDWNAVWEPAAKFLSPEQLVTFETAVEVWSLQRRISLGRAGAPGR